MKVIKEIIRLLEKTEMRVISNASLKSKITKKYNEMFNKINSNYLNTFIFKSDSSITYFSDLCKNIKMLEKTEIALNQQLYKRQIATFLNGKRIKGNMVNIVKRRISYRLKRNITTIVYKIRAKYIKILKDLNAQYAISYLNNYENYPSNEIIVGSHVDNISIPYVSKKALLIGINYFDTANELSGCINDAQNLEKRLLKNGFGNINILTDKSMIKPTKNNILNGLKTLLTQSKKGDLLFFSFSGHGTRIADEDNEETDGKDEGIVTIESDLIVDDLLNEMIKRYLKPNVSLVVIMDCCHSGTILDLKYQYFNSDNYENNTFNSANAETVGEVIMISGCKDSQTSADAFINTSSQGAMTWALLKTLDENAELSWKDLLQKMRDALKQSQFDQIPQLSSGKPFDMNSKVFI